MEALQFYKWQPKAACLSYSPDIFFDEAAHPHSDPTSRTRNRRVMAKRICAVCPVMKQCRETFISEPYGVFGGLDQEERATLRRRRQKQKKRIYAEEDAGAQAA